METGVAIQLRHIDGRRSGRLSRTRLKPAIYGRNVVDSQDCCATQHRGCSFQYEQVDADSRLETCFSRAWLYCISDHKNDTIKIAVRRQGLKEQESIVCDL
jgi:hypothetical protein